MLARQAHRIVKSRAVCHQRGGRQDAAVMRLDDAFIHVRREAEIVRIHHQLFSRAQNSFSWMVRNFLGFACMSFSSPWISRVAPLSVSYNCGLVTNCPKVPWPELIRSTVELSLPTRALIWTAS